LNGSALIIFHAWLSSDVVDTTSLYPTEIGDYRFSFREKYLASHTLTIKPTRGLDISIGESIIYANQLEFLYLVPITFFRLADHYLSRQANSAGSNSQFFAQVSSKGHIKNTHLYGTLFIDEFTIDGLVIRKQKKYRSDLLSAVQLRIYCSIISQSNWSTLKYNPYVYQHYINTYYL